MNASPALATPTLSELQNAESKLLLQTYGRYPIQLVRRRRRLPLR